MSDMTDASGQMPRRNPRVSDGGAPVSGAVAIVLALVAVVAGFLILNSISDGGDASLDFPADGASSGADADADSDSEVDPSATTVPGGSTTTTTTVAQIITDGADLIVANANGVSGSAGQMQRALELAGFTVVAAVDGSAALGDLEESVIYYDESNPQALAVATSLGEVLGGVSSIGPLTDPAPTADGDMQGADVLLMLGIDKAGKTLEELNPALNAPGTATEVTNPPIAGDTGDTTTTGG